MIESIYRYIYTVTCYIIFYICISKVVSRPTGNHLVSGLSTAFLTCCDDLVLDVVQSVKKKFQRNTHQRGEQEIREMIERKNEQGAEIFGLK